MLAGRAFTKPLPFILGTNGIMISFLFTDTLGLSAAPAIGMKVWREAVPWNFTISGGFQGIETVAGTFSSANAAIVANVVAELKTAGLTPLLVMTVNANPGLTSTWSSGPPTTPAQFAAAMAWLVAQPGLQGLHWELFNEPDGSAWGITPALLTAAFQAAYPAMKTADPTCTVHASAMENFSLVNGGQGVQYLNSCFTALPTWFNFYDIGGLHAYTPDPTFSFNISPDAIGAYGVPYWLGVANFQKARLAAGDTKPLWITEVGWPCALTTGNNPQSQAQWLQNCFEKLSGIDTVNGVPFSSYLKAVCQFSLTNNAGAAWALYPNDTTPANPGVAVLTEMVAGN